jgi:hypothetical protein
MSAVSRRRTFLEHLIDLGEDRLRAFFRLPRDEAALAGVAARGTAEQLSRKIVWSSGERSIATASWWMLAHRSARKNGAHNALEFDRDEFREHPIVGKQLPQGRVELGLS